MWRAVLAGIIGTILSALMWSGVVPSLNIFYGQISWLLLGIVTLIVMVVVGGPLYCKAWSNLLHARITMDTSIALSTIAAWLYSMLIVIWPPIVPVFIRHVYFEAAIFILCFINIGRALELRAVSKTSAAIERLFALRG